MYVSFKDDKIASINVGNIGSNDWKCSILDADLRMEENVFTTIDGISGLRISPKSVSFLERE